MALTLSPEIERVLAEEAAKRGKSPDELAEETFRVKFGMPVSFAGPLGEKLRAQANAVQVPPKELSAEEKELSAEEKEQRRQEALALIHSGYFAERLSSSDEFSARKAEEKALEERRWHK